MEDNYEFKYTLQDVLDAEKQNLFSVISTFAGGGGSSTGYRLAGGRILAINEFVEEAQKTYKANYPNTIILPDDIKEIDGHTFLEATGLKPGELDLFDGSPPCSAFSAAGAARIRQGDLTENYGKTKKYSDGKTVEAIEDLFLEFIRVAKVIQPKVIVAENVDGLTTKKARYKLNEFLRGFEDAGYYTTYKVLAASDYSVPQKRKRCIFVCVRRDIADEIFFAPEMQIGTLFPSVRPRVINLEEAIDNINNDPAEVQMLLDYCANSYQKQWMDQMPKNAKRKYCASEFHPKGSLFQLVRMCRTMPCATVTQLGQQKSASGLMHYGEDRKFTINELKRIQSLPDDFRVTGTFNQQAERICRMVPSLMMKAIAENINKYVFSVLKEKV